MRIDAPPQPLVNDAETRQCHSYLTLYPPLIAASPEQFKVFLEVTKGKGHPEALRRLVQTEPGARGAVSLM